MSITATLLVDGGPCPNCDGAGTLTATTYSVGGPARYPCGVCMGTARRLVPSHDRLAGDAIVEAMFAADPSYSRTRPMHENDWRPLPSVAEVLAHNARTGGDCFGPWLMLCESDEYPHGLRVEVIHLAADDDGVEAQDNDGVGVGACHRDGTLKFRPITRRGEALPWPEVPRSDAPAAAATPIAWGGEDDGW